MHYSKQYPRYEGFCFGSIVQVGYPEKPYNTCFKMLGDVVEDVRTVFERLGDTSIYIPTFV